MNSAKYGERFKSVLLVIAIVGVGMQLCSAADSIPSLTVDAKLGSKSVGEDWYQMAIWVEDKDGKYVDTLYVTDAVGREGLGNSYIKILGFTIRSVPGSLPVWAHARNVHYGKSLYPPKTEPLPDGMSGATVKADTFTKTFDLSSELASRIKEDNLVCRLELNVSRDDVPPMVFDAPISASNGASTFRFVGYGDESGETGTVSARDDLKVETSDYLQSADLKVKTDAQTLAKK